MIILKNFSKLIILIVFFKSTLFASEDFDKYKLDIIIKSTTNISFKSIAENEIIKGNIRGEIKNTPYDILNNASVECELLGRSYKGRGFSCGFAVVEDLKGLCFLSKLNNKDILMTSWNCSTTAGLSGDASCKGKLSVVEGFGSFAGVLGFGEIEMPLAKTLQEKNKNHRLKLILKIKYPLNVKKNWYFYFVW